MPCVRQKGRRDSLPVVRQHLSALAAVVKNDPSEDATRHELAP